MHKIDKSDVIICLLLVILAVGIVFAMQWKSGEDSMIKMFEEATKMYEQSLEDNAELRGLIEKDISLHKDTVELIKHERTIINNNYAKSTHDVYNADSGQQFVFYKLFSHRFDSSLYAGQFTTGN